MKKFAKWSKIYSWQRRKWRQKPVGIGADSILAYIVCWTSRDTSGVGATGSEFCVTLLTFGRLEAHYAALEVLERIF